MVKINSRTKKIVLIALLGALLSAFKMMLMFIPNIEVVTLILTTFTFVFGISITLPAALLFCTLEGMIFGFDPNILCYYIHWPMITIVCGLFAKLGAKSEYTYTGIVTVLTICFGFSSSIINLALSGAMRGNWIPKFFIIYNAGIVYYVLHVACNFILVILFFKPLTSLLSKLGLRLNNGNGNSNLKRFILALKGKKALNSITK